MAKFFILFLLLAIGYARVLNYLVVNDGKKETVGTAYKREDGTFFLIEPEDLEDIQESIGEDLFSQIVAAGIIEGSAAREKRSLEGKFFWVCREKYSQKLRIYATAKKIPPADQCRLCDIKTYPPHYNSYSWK